MKIGIHFGHWGSFYGQLGVRECLKQAKKAGADVLRVFPHGRDVRTGKRKNKGFKEVYGGVSPLPRRLPFGYPAGWDMAGEDEVLREATEHLKRVIEAMGILGAGGYWRNCIFQLAGRLFVSYHRTGREKEKNGKLR